MYTTKYLGARLKAARTAYGWSMRYLAERTGLTHQQISAYESGKRVPGTENLVKLAAVLGTPVEWLLNSDPYLIGHSVYSYDVFAIDQEETK